jgi:carbonic anhydrase/acetyltransferase-like protein (isoleucine patch superfamily)
MPGARVGDTVFLGEGTLVPPGMVLRDGAVAVERPARVIRTANEGDIERLRGLREADLSLQDDTAITIGPTTEAGTVGQLYDYRGIMPTIAPSAVLFPSAEITGDVVVGEGTIIGAGVKIIGDSHGPVRIGRDRVRRQCRRRRIGRAGRGRRQAAIALRRRPRARRVPGDRRRCGRSVGATGVGVRPERAPAPRLIG